MILDYQCFLKDNLSVSLPKFNCDEKEELFYLDVNFSVRFFMQLKSTQQELLNVDNDEDRVIQLLKNIAVEILNLDKSKHLTLQDIDSHFDDFTILKNLFYSILNYSKDIDSNDIYKLPDIKVKRQGVESSYEQLINYNDIEFMDGVTVVMQHTANSFNDVMEMPYTCYLATLKHVRLNSLLQDEEWNKEYLKWKYKVEYKKGNIEEEKQVASVSEIQKFASML